jgi:hypothetical protein
MRTITNNLADCELLNLETGTKGRGPFVIRQDGIAPGSMDQQVHRFLLRKDGTWVNSFAVYMLPEAEQQAQFTFESVAEIYALANTLVGKPKVEAGLPEGKSRSELLAAAESSISRVWSRIQSARGSKLK